MSKTLILFGSTDGNTEEVANLLGKKLSADVENVATFNARKLSGYKNLLLGTSTWGIGELQDDWIPFLDDLARADLAGKTIALFGLGDSKGYSDSFVDGMAIIYNAIKDKGCTIVGSVATDGYMFDASAAVVDGRFVGLPLDNDNQKSQTTARIEKWLAEITPHLQ